MSLILMNFFYIHVGRKLEYYIFLKLFLSALMMLVMSCGGGSGTIEEEKPTEGIPDETPSDLSLIHI